LCALDFCIIRIWIVRWFIVEKINYELRRFLCNIKFSVYRFLPAKRLILRLFLHITKLILFTDQKIQLTLSFCISRTKHIPNFIWQKMPLNSFLHNIKTQVKFQRNQLRHQFFYTQNSRLTPNFSTNKKIQNSTLPLSIDQKTTLTIKKTKKISSSKVVWNWRNPTKLWPFPIQNKLPEGVQKILTQIPGITHPPSYRWSKAQFASCNCQNTPGQPLKIGSSLEKKGKISSKMN
jgi:hypothetical protein